MHKRREANTSSPRIPGRAQRDRSLFRATKVMCRLSHIIDTIRIAGSTYDFDGCAAAEPYRLSGLSASTVKFLCKIILGLHEGDVCCGGCTLATLNAPSWSWSCFGTAACDPDLAAETVAAFNFAVLRFVVYLISEFRTDQRGAGVRAPGSPPPACSLGAPLRLGVADRNAAVPVSRPVSVIEAGGQLRSRPVTAPRRREGWPTGRPGGNFPPDGGMPRHVEGHSVLATTMVS